MISDMIHEVEIAADAAAVYRAITTREGQSGFWTADNTAEPEGRLRSALPLQIRAGAAANAHRHP